MFFITFSNLWSFSLFFYISYLLVIISLTLYLFSVYQINFKYNFYKNKFFFNFINSFDIYWLICIYLFQILFINILWVSPVLVIWFGHLVVDILQIKIVFIQIFFMYMYITVFLTISYFTSREIFDNLIVIIQFLYWLIFIFYSNTFFVVIFLIEVISTLILLFIVTSTFSSVFFYRNINLNYGHLTHYIIPSTYIQSILYIFWISLIASLLLFLFIILFYYKILTFDWYIIEHVFLYFINIINLYELWSLGFIWLIFISTLFLKCGLSPLYIWKPTFFKGISLNTLVFYIIFYYFFIYIYILYFLVIYLTEIFIFFILILWIFILLGLVLLCCIICETYYIKSFLAVSSILNSILIFLVIAVPHYIDIFIFI